MPKTDLSALDRQRELDFMRHPSDWPHWPRLPLKRGSIADPNSTGILLAVEGDWSTRVWFANLYHDILPNATPFKDYTDYDAILDDGWRID